MDDANQQPVVIIDLHELGQLRMAVADSALLKDREALTSSVHTCSQYVHYLHFDCLRRAAECEWQEQDTRVVDETHAQLRRHSFVVENQLHLFVSRSSTAEMLSTAETLSTGNTPLATPSSVPASLRSSFTLGVFGLQAEKRAQTRLLTAATDVMQRLSAGLFGRFERIDVGLHITHATATTAAGGAARCVAAFCVQLVLPGMPQVTRRSGGPLPCHASTLASVCGDLLSWCAAHTSRVLELRGRRVLVCDRVFGRGGRGCLLSSLYRLGVEAVFLASSPYFALWTAARPSVPHCARPLAAAAAAVSLTDCSDSRSDPRAVPCAPLTGLVVEFAADSTVVSVAWENKLCNWASTSVCFNSLQGCTRSRLDPMPVRWHPRLHRFFPASFRALVLQLLLVRHRPESSLHRLPLELFFLLLEHLADVTALYPSQADLLVRTTSVPSTASPPSPAADVRPLIPARPTAWDQDSLEQIRVAVAESYFWPQRHLYEMPMAVSRWRVILSEERGVHHLLLHCLSNVSSAVEQHLTANPVLLVVHGAAALCGLPQRLASELDLLHRDVYAYRYGQTATASSALQPGTWVQLRDLTPNRRLLLDDVEALEPPLWEAYIQVALHPFSPFVQRHPSWSEMWSLGNRTGHLFADG
mmetsp:Transcript_18129/g.54483  ORF Transcript_18129/g.54483 Transcript_18129/m.54483 type:complete len:643 (+) Transcript_18129:109-2037(+)